MALEKIINDVFKVEKLEENVKEFPLGIMVKNALYAEWDGSKLSIKIAGIELVEFNFDDDMNLESFTTNQDEADKFEKWVKKNFKEWKEGEK